MHKSQVASLFKATVEVRKGAPMGNDNAKGPHKPYTRGGAADDDLVSVRTTPVQGNTNGPKKIPPAPKFDKTKSLIDNLEQAIPGMKPGRNMVGGHPVDIKDGPPDEGVDMRGADQAAAQGALKHLRGRGFPVKRHNDTEFTVGGTFQKEEGGFSSLLKGAPMGNRNAAGPHGGSKGGDSGGGGAPIDPKKSHGALASQLAKTYGGVKAPSSGTRVFPGSEVSLPKAGEKALAADLKAQGWTTPKHLDASSGVYEKSGRTIQISAKNGVSVS